MSAGRGFVCSGLRSFEEDDAGGEAVDKVLAADGADFAHGEEAGEGDGPHDFMDCGDVVVRGVEEACAAAVAGEEEGAVEGGAGAGEAFVFEEGAEVFVGGAGVSNVELDGLADADGVGDGEAAGVVGADDVADEKVAAVEGFLIFVDDAADVEALLDALLVVFVEYFEDFAEDFEGGAAAELADDVAVGAGDDHGMTDGAATLADDGADGDGSVDLDGDRAGIEDFGIEDEAVFARGLAGAGHAADDSEADRGFTDLFEELVGGEGEGVAEEDEGGGRG